MTEEDVYDDFCPVCGMDDYWCECDEGNEKSRQCEECGAPLRNPWDRRCGICEEQPA